VIAHVRGRIVSRTSAGGREAATRLVVDVGGVGYAVLVPAGLAGRLPAQGEEAVVHTSLQVREDDMSLYGFPDAATRDLFELLLGASGVGPKLALAMLSTHPPATLIRAIADGDLDTLATVPGIGRKSAQRIVLELKDQLGGVGEIDLVGAGGPGGTAVDGARTEAHLALLELGYTSAEARGALSDVDDEGHDTAALVRAALRNLTGVQT
jgi:holliday junction DNA helicase RuvA